MVRIWIYNRLKILNIWYITTSIEVQMQLNWKWHHSYKKTQMIIVLMIRCLLIIYSVFVLLCSSHNQSIKSCLFCKVIDQRWTCDPNCSWVKLRAFNSCLGKRSYLDSSVWWEHLILFQTSHYHDQHRTESHMYIDEAGTERIEERWS